MEYSKELKNLLSCCKKASQDSGLGYISSVDLYVSTVLYILNTSDKLGPIQNKIKELGQSRLLPEEVMTQQASMVIDPELEEDNGVLLGKEATQVLQNAENESRLMGSDQVSIWHLLMSFTKRPGLPKKLLKKNGLTYKSFYEMVDKKEKPKLKSKSINNNSNSPSQAVADQLKNLFSGLGVNIAPIKIDMSNLEGESDDDDEASGNIFEAALSGKTKESGETSLKYLEKYAKNMNKLAQDDTFDPIQGRSTEIDLLIKYLGCKKKNNVVLLGDPGVGKTTIVEGLCQRIVNGNVPDFLKEKIIYSLDLNALVAGTKYRGQYEERLQGIIKEVTKNKNIIIFIDEFHNLIGNGSSDGNGDASNVLKPYLARGEFQCIGSTTFGEYRKYVEKDGALKRRFHNIPVYEPSQSECFEILKTIAPKYENYHKVKFSDDVLKLCVSLSQRYITDRFLPDKAIDILDLSGSEAKLNAIKDSRLEKLEELQRLKKESIISENYEDAIKYREQEKLLKEDIESNDLEKSEVTEEVVYSAISKISGIPVDNIGKSDMSKLRGMKKTLDSVVIGQDEAVKTILGALQKNSLGLRDPKKPIASILCVGPSGTGKTHICKQIAKEFFGSEDSLIRFDMSEYTEKHEVTKLIGASASYVGYDDEPLFYKIKRKPYSVVLFDEIEKADKGIFPILLNILDEGYVTAANGTVIDFKNTIIVLTGNIGTKDLMVSGTAVGFGNTTPDDQNSRNHDIILKAIKKTFSPEFINRLSSTVYFNKLTDDNMKSICDIELKKLEDRIKSKGYKNLIVSDDIKTKIIKGCDLNYGARDLQREISKIIEESICDYLLNNDVPDDLKTIEIFEKDSNIMVNFK